MDESHLVGASYLACLDMCMYVQLLLTEWWNEPKRTRRAFLVSLPRRYCPMKQRLVIRIIA